MLLGNIWATARVMELSRPGGSFGMTGGYDRPSPSVSGVVFTEDHREPVTGPAAGSILRCGPHLQLRFCFPDTANVSASTPKVTIYSMGLAKAAGTPAAQKGKSCIPDRFTIVTTLNAHSSSRGKKKRALDLVLFVFIFF